MRGVGRQTRLLAERLMHKSTDQHPQTSSSQAYSQADPDSMIEVRCYAVMKTSPYPASALRTGPSGRGQPSGSAYLPRRRPAIQLQPRAYVSAALLSNS
jgi:hypothetical protein